MTRLRLIVAVAAACLCVGAAPARADWSGDGPPDVLAVDSGGRLLLYRGTTAGRFAPGGGQPIGTGWGSFTALLAPADWSGDGKPDLLARNSAGALLMYRGNGAGGFLNGHGEQIGSGWQDMTALLAPRDWNGDGKSDILARTSAGKLLMYRGNGSGGFLPPTGQQIGSGWQVFNALFAGGDFSGDGKPDILARDANGLLFVYRGNGRGGFITGQREQIGSGWGSLGSLLLAWGPPRPPAPPPPPPAPPSVPLTNGSAKLYTGKNCTRPGGRLKVRMRIRRRPGRSSPRVLFVVFFVRHGSRRVDHRRPFVVRLRMHQRAGKRGRVYARVFYKRAGSAKLRHKTVSRKFKMCRLAR